jgi:C1A family cysteine protease
MLPARLADALQWRSKVRRKAPAAITHRSRGGDGLTGNYRSRKRQQTGGQMNTTPEGLGLGWLADHPDMRDHTVDTDSAPAGKQHSVAALLKEVATPATPPKSVDLRADFSPVEDQGHLGSCTANAGAGMIEYFQRRAYGKYVDLSRLFLYKTTRDLLGVHGDTGAYLRSTMQALATFGAPPEVYWPYDTTKFDIEPSAFLYTFGQDYKAEIYYRLDPPGTTGSALVDVIKQQLARQLPAMFGFTVYSSYQQSLTNGGEFPYPAQGEARVGGHAIVACGYDDAKKVTNTSDGGGSTKGAFLIRNSWGSTWGESGYGWLPYKYVTSGLAVDWWSLISADWIDTGAFN